LKSFIQKAQPLLDLGQIEEEALEEFNQSWKNEASKVEENDELFCTACT
jgi:hypothetical protein